MDEKLDQIREEILSASKPLLFFDTDSDGTMSYYQLKKLAPSLEGYHFDKKYEHQMENLSHVSSSHDLIIFFDTPHIEEDFLKKLSSKKIIWVDHHPGNDNRLILKYDILHFNPLSFDSKDSRPSCYWAYRVANQKENLPYLIIGSIADFYLLEEIKEFYNYDKSLFNLLFTISKEKQLELFSFLELHSFNDADTQEERENWIRFLSYETSIGKLKIFFDFIYKLDQEEIYQIVSNLEEMSIQELLICIEKSDDLLFLRFRSYLNSLEKLVETALKKYKGEKYFKFKHKGTTSYNRQVAEELLYRLKNVLLVQLIFEKEGSSYISCSFRAKKGFEINSYVEKSVQEVDAVGGGHKYAAGAVIKKKNFPHFQMFFEELIYNDHRIN